MAEAEEQFMSIRWDDDRDRPTDEHTVSVARQATTTPADPISAQTWNAPSTSSYPGASAGRTGLSAHGSGASAGGNFAPPFGAGRAALAAENIEPPKWQGYLVVQVHDPHKEGASGPQTSASSTVVIDELSIEAAAANGGMTTGNQGKDVHVTYGIRAETNLPHFDRTRMWTRRRYRDFEFLHDALQRDLPACLVPPLPDKHRIEYVTGSRFSPEFIARRTLDLQIFMERICRHPHLMRMLILRSFLESNEWSVDMHAHLSASRHASNLSATGDADREPGILDSWSDAIVNAFTKTKKPDERFVALASDLDRFDVEIGAIERTINRGRNRASDLSVDYEELAASVDVLAELETRMSSLLHRFASTLTEYGQLERLDSARSLDRILTASQALLSYSQAYKQLLRVRDNKQVDFEELTDYLSTVVTERDRLAPLASQFGMVGGVRGAGIMGYLRDRVDAWRGVDEERTRVERMQRLDKRIKELQDAVANSHEMLQGFSQHVLSEALLFECAKQHELQGVLGQMAQSKVELFSQSVQMWDRLLENLGAGPQ